MTAAPLTCAKCGRQKHRHGTRNGRPVYLCRHRGTPRDAEAQAARPWCVACRRVMNRDRRRFVCIGCGVTCGVDTTPRLAPIPDRPDCPACARPMMHKRYRLKDGSARVYFNCRRCRTKQRKAREAEALRVLATLAESLPRYLTPDEREDAAQSIALDILAGRLAADALTPKALRSYVAAARGLANNRFKFISLSQPTSDGRTFGDLLAA